MTKLFKILFLSVLGLAGIQQSANAGLLITYPKLYVFGDSLSDTGNDFLLTTKLFKPLIDAGYLPADFPSVPPSVSPHKTYYKGRFSNGMVAVEYLCSALYICRIQQLKPSESVANFVGESALNFAYGGSQSGISNITPGGFPVPGALGQTKSFIDAYQAKGKAVPHDALYLIWTGANDYLSGQNPDPALVVGNISQAIDALYSAGARKFLVPNLVDLGALPINHYFPVGTSTVLTALTKAHNTALASALQSLQHSRPGINLVTVDIYTLFDQLKVSLNIGIGPGGDCLISATPYNCTDVVNFEAPGYLFWDIEHPTTVTHKLIALIMLKNLI
jgi:phospholipase/lecithinase/hemolysin